MKRNINLSFVTLSLVALTLGACSDSAMQDETNESVVTSKGITLVDSEGKEITDFSNACGTYYVKVQTDGAWELKTDNQFVCLSKTSGAGSALVPFTLYNNWYGARRFSITSDIEGTAVTRATSSTSSASGSQAASDETMEQLKKRISSNLGAGYTVVPRSDGNVALSIGVQLFNMSNLETLTSLNDSVVYILDEYYDMNQQYTLSSSSNEALHKGVTVGANASLTSGGLSGSGSVGVGVDNSETSTKTYAVKRMLREMYSREINYANAIANDANPDKALYHKLLTPGFRMVRDNVISGVTKWVLKDGEVSSSDSAKADAIIEQFIYEYGSGFISKSLIGCSLDYYIGVETSDLKDGLSVKAVLDGKYSSQVKDSTNTKTSGSSTSVDGSINVDYEKNLSTAMNNSESQVIIYGGNTDDVNILTTGGELESKVIDAWRGSITPKNAVMVDVEVQPITVLFEDYKDVSAYIYNYLKRHQATAMVTKIQNVTDSKATNATNE